MTVRLVLASAGRGRLRSSSRVPQPYRPRSLPSARTRSAPARPSI